MAVVVSPDAQPAVREALRGETVTFWLEAEQCCARPGGELGFPNELIRMFAPRPGGVLACPLADWREQQGIKERSDITLCERYLRELSQTQ